MALMIADLPLSFLPTSAVIGANAFDRGLIVYLCSENAEGVPGDTVVVAPPYNVSEDGLSESVDVLSLSINGAVKSAKS
jgi:adenosylmethionine-8-amino-7-oxononanoate aminotransferase